MRMKRKKKLIVTVLFCISLLATMTVHASSTEYKNLSVNPPILCEKGISTYGLGSPSTDNVYANGTQSYVSGEANNSKLYTNKCFYGVSKITASIVNESDKKLTVRLYNYVGAARIATTKTATISAGSKGSFHFDGLKSTTYYYLSFSAPSNFHGFVGGVASSN